MRVGVFGGSFDPVHCGHLVLARAAAEKLSLAQVLFIPTRLQPLKVAGPRAGAGDRLAMLRLALAGAPDFRLDEREVARPGPSYTIDTLRALKAERPRDQLFLMLGADAARELPRWKESAEISRLATIVVIPRTGSVELPPGTVPLDVHPPDISATGVREAVARGTSLDGMVPTAVARYIAARGLYRTGA